MPFVITNSNYVLSDLAIQMLNQKLNAIQTTIHAHILIEDDDDDQIIIIVLMPIMADYDEKMDLMEKIFHAFDDILYRRYDVDFNQQPTFNITSLLRHMANHNLQSYYLVGSFVFEPIEPSEILTPPAHLF